MLCYTLLLDYTKLPRGALKWLFKLAEDMCHATYTRLSSVSLLNLDSALFHLHRNTVLENSMATRLKCLSAGAM